jgi:deoxyribodipyrimidine photo-lyase
MMNRKNINTYRKNVRIDGAAEGDYVLYWMQINRRLHYNFALEYAVAYSNKLHKPLVILEGLACDYPWATVRTSTFILQGMAEHLQQLGDARAVTYIPYPEEQKGSYGKLVRDLCRRASILISDEYPVFIMRERNERLENELAIPFHTVDANGIIPMALSEKAPYSAFIFRQLMQKTFLECWQHPPQEHPLMSLGQHGDPGLPSEILERRQAGMKRLASENEIGKFTSGLSGLNQDIGPIDLKGTRSAGLKRLDDFTGNDLLNYEEDRNEPDKERTSRLSPWLHFGKLSSFEVVSRVFAMQPDGWDIADSRPVGGKRSGFFRGHPGIESFLDELITWRETGFHFAWHTPDYDQFDSLPDWARETLSDHADDPREHLYSYKELAGSQTHDPVWNAAQTQLRREGRIHNYLRMLWGKKVLEWTPDPQTALSYLIDLNNEYAIDGRDPNSYSGIFWIFGRFDRAWGPERPVFGKIRYMSSDSARKKVKLDNYLKRYSDL